MGVFFFLRVYFIHKFYLFLFYMRKWSLVKHSAHVFNICGYY